MESNRLQQTITSLRDELDTTKSELASSRGHIEQFKGKVSELMFALENEQRSRSEVEDESKRLAQEVTSRDRQLDHMSQQLIVAEGELEQSTEDAKHLRNSLDAYKQKFETCVNQISSLETDLVRQNEKLQWSQKQVSTSDHLFKRLFLDF